MERFGFSGRSVGESSARTAGAFELVSFALAAVPSTQLDRPTSVVWSETAPRVEFDCGLLRRVAAKCRESLSSSEECRESGCGPRVGVATGGGARCIVEETRFRVMAGRRRATLQVASKLQLQRICLLNVATP